MSEYILKGRLITAASDEVIAHGTVIVKDDRIVFAGPSETAPECSGAADAVEGIIWSFRRGLWDLPEARLRPCR